MRERLVTLLLALGALLVFYALFIPKPRDESKAPSMPLSTDIRADGYHALWRWLGAQGIPTTSFRGRYDQLPRRTRPEGGNLLITTLPHTQPARGAELDALTAWVERGNTLLVLAALDDTPAWALGSEAAFLAALNRMTGLGFTALQARSGDAAASKSPSRSVQQALREVLQSRQESILPRGAHPLLAGIGAIATESAYPASRWIATVDPAAVTLELADRADRAPGRDAPEPAMWLRPRGQGQVIVLAYASPFTNAVIGRADNARLFANIVGHSLQPRGAVLFDDAHQGLVDYYDARAFFADSRLHHTLLWLVVLWLLFVLGWQRLRAPAQSWNPVDVTTFIKVTGGFLAARSGANAVARRLLANFFNRIRQRLALPQDGEPLWDWLAAQATVPPGELARLRALHARAQARERIDLVQLQNCLTGITGKLL